MVPSPFTALVITFSLFLSSNLVTSYAYSLFYTVQAANWESASQMITIGHTLLS